MRIVCEKCAAAYALEDRLVTAKGVRAQCPRCRHLQRVQRGAETAPPREPDAWAAVAMNEVQPLPETAPSDWSFLPPERPPEVHALRELDASDADILELEPLGIHPPCTRCATPLTDPFDQALGMCESCRQKVHRPPPERTGEVEPRLKPVARPLSPPRVTPARARRSSPPWVLLLVPLLLFVTWGGFTWRRSRAQNQSRLTDAHVTRILESWRAALPSTDSTATELVAQAQVKLDADRPKAYGEAALLFQQALLRDPSNTDAVAGYLQALALGLPNAMDGVRFADALTLGKITSKHAQCPPAVLVGIGNLLLARPAQEGHTDEARQLADEALKESGGAAAAEAHLLAARTFLPDAPQLALPHLDQALARNENLRRAYSTRAVTRELLGDDVGARADFERRLALDGDHVPSLWELGRLYMELGETAQARKLYQSAQAFPARRLQASVALGVLRYQVEGKPAEAAALFKTLLKGKALESDPADAATVFIHLAAAERLLGSAEEAVSAATSALGLSPDDGAAHLQLILLALEARDAKAAGVELPLWDGNIPKDPALGEMVSGRLKWLTGDVPGAVQHFVKAAALGTRVDAALWAALGAWTQGQPSEALRWVNQAALRDPSRTQARNALGRFFTRPGDLLRGADEEAAKLTRGSKEVVPLLIEAMARFHLRDPTADKAFVKVLELDEGNALAYGYRALLALEHHDVPGAEDSAEKSVEAGRQVALAHYALASVRSAQGQGEEARRSLRDAESLAPGWPAAELMLAELEAKAGNPAAATDRLRKLIRLDPSETVAKRALFALEEKKTP